MDQHLADVEDDMADFGHNSTSLVRSFQRCAGYGRLDGLFHDGRQGLACQCCRRRPPAAGRGGGITGHVGAEDLKVEREMGEDVARRCPARRQSAANGAAAARSSPSSRAVQALVGTSLIPPSRPLSGALAQAGSRRRRARRRRPRRAAAASRPLPRAPAERSDRRRPAPRQSSLSGQSMQAGRLGVQIVAPRSIIACAKSPGRRVRRQALDGLRGSAAWPPAAASRSRRAARSRARHCRRPPRPADRRRSRRSPRPCRRRCPATRAAPPRCRESGRRARRPPCSAQAIRLRARE